MNHAALCFPYIHHHHAFRLHHCIHSDNLCAHPSHACTHNTPFPSHALTGYIGEFEIVDDHRGGKIVVDVSQCSSLPACRLSCDSWTPVPSVRDTRPSA